jgi:hypothetical protein
MLYCYTMVTVSGLLYDGRPPSRVATEFRRNNKDAIQVTAARTIGHYIAATGLCF